MNDFIRQKWVLDKILNKVFPKGYQDLKFFVAGGACRAAFAKEQISDLDIYFEDGTAFKALNDYLDGNDDEKMSVIPILSTLNAETYSVNAVKVQLIKKIYGTPEDIIKQFDFTVCMCAYIPGKGFVMDEHFIEDIAARMLVFNINAKYPINSMWRVQKFEKKGYYLPAVESIKLALCINNLQMKTHFELKEQLDGIDTAFLSAITDKLMTNHEKEYDFRNAITLIEDILSQAFVAEIGEE